MLFTTSPTRSAPRVRSSAISASRATPWRRPKPPTTWRCSAIVPASPRISPSSMPRPTCSRSAASRSTCVPAFSTRRCCSCARSAAATRHVAPSPDACALAPAISSENSWLNSADAKRPSALPRAVPPAAAAVPVAAPAAPPANGKGRRRRALLGVTGAVLLGGIAYAVYWALVLNHYESTDNAYVQGNVVQLTPQVAGTVVAIAADDTDFVKAGQPLVKLDPADARVALDQAEAQLAQAVRETRTLFVNNGTLKAQIASREADLARARSEVARAEDDVSRRARLVAPGSVGKEEFSHVTSQLAVAKAGLGAAESGAEAAREQLASNQSLTEGISVGQD